MATAKKRSRKASARRPARVAAGRARLWPRLVLALAVVAAILAWNYRKPVMEQAMAGTAYGARVGCACRYIGGRSLEDCRKDYEPGMALISLSEDDDARSVTASVPLLVSQTATFREGYGCVLEEWQD
jgi:hypothetical protein